MNTGGSRIEVATAPTIATGLATVTATPDDVARTLPSWQPDRAIDRITDRVQSARRMHSASDRDGWGNDEVEDDDVTTGTT